MFTQCKIKMLRTKLVKTQKGEEKLESSTRQCCEPGRTERGGDNASGHSYGWAVLPKPDSDVCVVRI